MHCVSNEFLSINIRVIDRVVWLTRTPKKKTREESDN